MEDCVDDQRYIEANFIYEWLWEMDVFTDRNFLRLFGMRKTAGTGSVSCMGRKD